MSRKKRVICLLLATVMCISCLSGCVFGKREYTLSEYIDSKDIVIMYQSDSSYFKKDKKPKFISVFKDGKVFRWSLPLTWEELSGMTDEEIYNEVISKGHGPHLSGSDDESADGKWANYLIGINTDQSGNDTDSEYIMTNHKFKAGSKLEISNNVICALQKDGFKYDSNNGDILDSKYISCANDNNVDKGAIDEYYYIRDDKDITINLDKKGTKGIEVDMKNPKWQNIPE